MQTFREFLAEKDSVSLDLLKSALDKRRVNYKEDKNSVNTSKYNIEVIDNKYVLRQIIGGKKQEPQEFESMLKMFGRMF